MENREILIANTKTQKRSKITTNATTLGELKAALDNANIDYTGMTFTEGISKTQLLDDATQLPQNVMYKGNPTNNLVILLTNTKKNIASGIMSRQEAYSLIKEHSLQDNIKNAFGKNYTLISTNELENFIGNALHKDCAVPENKSLVNTDNDIDKALHKAIIKFVQTLFEANILKRDIILDMADDIYTLVQEDDIPTETPHKVESTDGNITSSDIDDMIADLNI